MPVNALEVPAGQEEQFLAGWQHAADWMRQQPGFVSSRLHRSLDPDAASTHDPHQTIRRWWRYNGTLAESRNKVATRHPLDHRPDRGES